VGTATTNLIIENTSTERRKYRGQLSFHGRQSSKAAILSTGEPLASGLQYIYGSVGVNNPELTFLISREGIVKAVKEAREPRDSRTEAREQSEILAEFGVDPGTAWTPIRIGKIPLAVRETDSTYDVMYAIPMDAGGEMRLSLEFIDVYRERDQANQFVRFAAVNMDYRIVHPPEIEVSMAAAHKARASVRSFSAHTLRRTEEPIGYLSTIGAIRGGILPHQGILAAWAPVSEPSAPHGQRGAPQVPPGTSGAGSPPPQRRPRRRAAEASPPAVAQEQPSAHPQPPATPGISG
jgi:hypothetical protein